MQCDLNRGLEGGVGIIIRLACGGRDFGFVVLKSKIGGFGTLFSDPIVKCQDECLAEVELTVLFKNGESGEFVG